MPKYFYKSDNLHGDREYVYRDLLLKKKIAKQRKARLKKRMIANEVKEEVDQEYSFREKVSTLNGLLDTDNNIPKTNLASQIRSTDRYKHDGAAMAQDDYNRMPNVVDEYAGKKFKKMKKDLVKKAMNAKDARKLKKSYKAVKTTAQAAKTAKGAKNIGLVIKSALTISSIESFGIGLLVNLLLILLQMVLYYVFDIKSLKLEWYDWAFLVAIVVLLVVIGGFVYLTIFGSLYPVVELGYDLFDWVSS